MIFFPGARPLPLLSSFIIKRAVNNHLVVGTIISASINVWHSETDNFPCSHRGSNRPCLSRGVLNSICQLRLHHRHRAVPQGRDLFSWVSVWGRPREKESEYIIKCKCSGFDEFVVLAFYRAKTCTSVWQRAMSRSDLWLAWKVEGKRNDSGVF